jgi:hypothetical protein
MYLVAYGMLLTESLHFGQHAMYCTVECKNLSIMQATSAACRMTPVLPAASAAGCAPNALILFFINGPKLLKVYYASTVFELS